MTDASKPRRRTKELKDRPASAVPGPRAEEAAEPIDADNLDEAFVMALEQDFLEFGMTAIRAMRVERPADYVKIVMALRASQAGGAPDPLREMSDAELDRCIREVAARAGLQVRPADAPPRGGAAGDDSADAD
jgi:hypothetical protein